MTKNAMQCGHTAHILKTTNSSLENMEHVVEGHPSRLNGENIAGAAFLFLAFLFFAAGTVNPVFALIYPVNYLLVAIGAGLVLLGYRTWRNRSRSLSEGSASGSKHRW